MLSPRRRAAWLLAIALVVVSPVATLPVVAHETDQYTLPPGREFADLSDYLTRYVYNTLAKGVERQNSRIKDALAKGAKAEELKNLQSPDELAASVNKQFPVALFFINGLDELTARPAFRADYPGRIVGYKPSAGVRKHVDIPLNPLNAWGCATIRAYGVYFGTDKMGHFSDMGMHYFRTYRKALKDGKTPDDAMKAALRLGTEDPITSERGMLGLVTAGGYSNADLVANFMGMCFYRNLAEPIMLKGQQRPPMLVLEDNLWKFNAHVRPDGDFFSWFVSDHFNEALNPSLYRDDMRPKIKRAVQGARHLVLARYTDPNGNSWSQGQFQAKSKELETYWGLDYGHWGENALLTVARTCFAPPPDMTSPSARNDDGLTSMHFAAQQGDVAALQNLINLGGDVNARVQSQHGAPAVANDTPLHLAARDGRLAAAQLLLSRGADVNARNDRGDTPLHMAVAYPQMAEVLIRSGADVDAADRVGRTPMHWAARDARATTTVQLLLDSAARPQPVDRDGQTPLHEAARAAHAQAVVALVRGGADASAPDGMGITPLHLAAADAGAAVTDLLVQAGASADSRDDFGFTPLHVAASQGQAGAVERLLARGADAAATDAYGKDAMTVASLNRYPEVVQLLKDRAVVPQPQQPDAQTAAGQVGPRAAAPAATGARQPQPRQPVNASALPQVRGD
ncbi:MAG TPA: ankyrin repeat domain-containing protein [Tepidisphaeraceae bacterium]|nr:ankyrin repeat domain-containing protein [Tepidisphaeraceae bacterium]